MRGALELQDCFLTLKIKRKQVKRTKLSCAGKQNIPDLAAAFSLLLCESFLNMCPFYSNTVLKILFKQNFVTLSVNMSSQPHRWNRFFQAQQTAVLWLLSANTLTCWPECNYEKQENKNMMTSQWHNSKQEIWFSHTLILFFGTQWLLWTTRV